MQCEVLNDSPTIHFSTKTLIALAQLPTLMAPPTIVRTGDGRYTIIQTDVPGPNPTRRTVYIGRLSKEEQAWLNRGIASNWPAHAAAKPAAVMNKELADAKAARRSALAQARQAAAACGFYFHGRHIRRRRCNSPGNIESLKEFQQSLQVLLDSTNQYLSLYQEKMAVWVERKFMRRHYKGMGMLGRRRLLEKATADGMEKSNQEIQSALSRIQKVIQTGERP